MLTQQKCLLLVVVGISCFSQTKVWAGAWSQEQGHYYVKLSGIFYASEQFYNNIGKRQPIGMDHDRFEASKAFLYMEYGVMKRLTLIAQLQQGVLTSENDLVRRKTTGVGDADLGLKYQATDKPLVVTPFMNVKIPTGYHKDYRPALGTGKADLEFRLLVARSLYPWPIYLGAEAGYRFNGGTYSNQIPYFLEVGGLFHKKIFVKGYVEGRNTRKKRNVNTWEAGSSSLWVFEGDFTKAGCDIAIRVPGSLWINMLVETIFTGENAGAGESFGFGVSYRY